MAMDGSQLQEYLENSRAELLLAIESLPDEALLEPGAAGDWSVRDVLGHLTHWEAELVTALLRLKRGQKPDHLLAAMAGRDAYNAGRAAEVQQRDLDQVFEDFQNVRIQLEEWLVEFSDRDLTNPTRYPALDGRPLWRVIAENSFEHEAEHTADLAAFAARWEVEHSGSPADDAVIWLSTSQIERG